MQKSKIKSCLNMPDFTDDLYQYNVIVRSFISIPRELLLHLNLNMRSYLQLCKDLS